MLVTEEIQHAIKELSLGDKDIRQVKTEEAKVLYFELLEEFVEGGDRRCWWESFKRESESVQFDDGKGFERIIYIVPDEHEIVWFVTEEDQLPFYPIYESTPKIIQRIIGECYAFEYYIVPKSKEWLLSENHHNYLIGVGKAIIEKLGVCRA